MCFSCDSKEVVSPYCCVTLCYTALHCVTLCYTVLHCITLCYTALCCVPFTEHSLIYTGLVDMFNMWSHWLWEIRGRPFTQVSTPTLNQSLDDCWYYSTTATLWKHNTRFQCSWAHSGYGTTSEVNILCCSMEVIGSPPCLCLLDNYVHRLVQNKEDGKLVEVAGQGGMVGCQSHSQTGTSFPASLGMRLSIHGIFIVHSTL